MTTTAVEALPDLRGGEPFYLLGGCMRGFLSRRTLVIKGNSTLFERKGDRWKNGQPMTPRGGTIEKG